MNRWSGLLFLSLLFSPVHAGEMPIPDQGIEKTSASSFRTLAEHFLRRTGFEPTEQETQSAIQFPSYEALIENTIESNLQLPPIVTPDWATFFPLVNKKTLRREERQAHNKLRRQWEKQLQALWYQHMLTTKAPLLAGLALFWHNLLTTERTSVKSAQLLWRQFTTIRSHSMGNIRELIKAIAMDPAMMIYLNLDGSHKTQPNENFARELLELFTMGEGYYEEKDVTELARALTGWRVVNGEVIFFPERFDSGYKIIFGKRAKFDMDSAIDWVFQQPRVANFFAERFYLHYVSPDVDEKVTDLWANVLRENDYELKPLLLEIFLSDAFRHSAPMIKSPVELAVGIGRKLRLEAFQWDLTQFINNNLEQELYNPPGVEGWPRNKEWITPDSMVARSLMIDRFFPELTQQQANELKSSTFQYK